MSASLTDRLEQFFRQHEGEWIHGMELAKVAGCFAWRTRVSNVRLRGLAIQNRQRRVRNADGKPYTISEYRYLVRDPEPVSLLDLVEQATG